MNKAWMLKLFGPLLLGAGILAAVVLLGRIAVDRLGGDERYAARFTDIDCNPPPHGTREELLLEVQYESELPAEFSILDKTFLARLSEAFARHAWVEKVERIWVHPSRTVHVELHYRQPVLVVPSGGGQRVVDRDGIVLPSSARSIGLPVLETKVAPPSGRTGTAWGDPRVAAAARTVGLLHSDQVKLQLSVVAVEDGRVFLKTTKGLRVHWGLPPGLELDGEATAGQKRERLLRHAQKAGDLDLRSSAPEKRP